MESSQITISVAMFILIIYCDVNVFLPLLSPLFLGETPSRSIIMLSKHVLSSRLESVMPYMA